MNKLFGSILLGLGCLTGSLILGGAPALSQSNMGGPGAALTPDDTIGRSVVDSKGERVGRVKDFKMDAAGNAHLIVGLADKDVALPATEFQVASNTMLKTSQPLAQIRKLPPAEPSIAGSVPPGEGKPVPGTEGIPPNSGTGPRPSAPTSPVPAPLSP
jgi:hypothetical protein